MNDIDYEIIQSCLSGNVDDYSNIVDKYQQTIYKQVFWYSENQQTAEELTHEVFVQAFLSLDKYQAKAPFVHWLRRIASHIGCKHIKEIKKMKKHFSIEGWDAPIEDKQNIDEHETAQVLKELLSILSAEDRMVLTMLYVEGLSIKKIASRMNWNSGMVKMRVFRAKNKIKKHVDYSDKKADYKALLSFCYS